jgi:archaeosine-15-forming tRNA-guanine transglycosylase
MKKIALLLVIFATAISSFAQDEIFKVLITKGSNKAIVASSTTPQDLIVGKKIYTTDKIVVATGGYLGLSHKSGKTIEIKTPGTYEVSKLVAQVNTQNASVSSKYVTYVAGQMTANNEDLAANRYKHMAVTGSVERATDKIKPMAPSKAIVLDELVILKWNSVNVDSVRAKTYLVSFTNLYGEELLVKAVSDTFLILDLVKINLKTEKNIVWSVKVKEAPSIKSDDYSLVYVSETSVSGKTVSDEKKATELHNQFTALKTELTEKTALNKLILASFCAENKLTLNAMEYYEEAIALEPEVDEFKIVYGKYLADAGLAKVAE